MKIIDIKEAIERAWAGFSPRKGLPELSALAAPELLKMFPRFEQIAFYAPDMLKTQSDYRRLGCDNWVEDKVTAEGTVGVQWTKDQRKDVTNVAQLSFNYDLGIELELIRYIAGFNWHQLYGRVEPDGDCREPFLSHMSYHVDNILTEQTRLERLKFNVTQSVRTISHTNVHLVRTGRKYKYVIFNTRPLLGFDIKLIERVETK